MDEQRSESALQDDRTEFAREWTEILNEIRVVLPGVQLLFGFLLAAPFNDAFRTISGVRRTVYFIAFLTAAASSAFLIAPSVYHRLHWRRDVRDKEQMLRISNRLAITGGALLAVATSEAVFVVSDLIAGFATALFATGGAALMFLLLWFALPLSRRARERRDRSRPRH